jgi:hypothetical protein
VAFDEDIAAVAVGPATLDPAGVRVRGLDVGSGNPDVVFAIPAVIAGVPGPVWMFVRCDRDDFNGARRGRADADDHLCANYAGAQQNDAGGNEELLLHGFLSP